MDAEGDWKRDAGREDEALGPHAMVEREPKDPVSPEALEAVDTDQEYALIPVEEDDEDDEDDKDRNHGPRVVVGSEHDTRAAREGGRDTVHKSKAEAVAAATCPEDGLSPAPSATAPEPSDTARVLADGDAADHAKVASDAAAAAPSPPASDRGDEREEEEAIELSLGLSDSSVEPSTGEAPEEPEEDEQAVEPAAEADTAVGVAVEAAADPMAGKVADAVAEAEAEAAAVAPTNGTSAPLLPPGRRKRKRARKHVFSSRPKAGVAKLKLEGLKPAPVAVEAEQTDHAHGKKRHLELAVTDASPGQESTFLYPSTPTSTAWQWDSCEAYFAPVSQENLDDLERVRKSQANFVAANAHACRALPDLGCAYLDAMTTDASDRSSARVLLDQRRGRYYRDLWEEEDFVAVARRRLDDEEDDAPAVLQSNHELVFGYDDDLFRDYLARLEAAAAAVGKMKKDALASAPQPDTPSQPQKAAATRRSSKQSSSSKRSKKAARVASPKRASPAAYSPLEDVLPLLPCHHLHPASLGWWKLAKDRHPKEPSFAVVHPASLGRYREPVRWIEEAEAYRKRLQEEEEKKARDHEGDSAGDGNDSATGPDGVEAETKAPSLAPASESVETVSQTPTPLELPSFGNAGLEQDDISRAIAASVAKLVPLSISNWRALQMVYERAACAQQCASIFEAEAAAKKSLEHLYSSVFAPAPEQQAAGVSSAASTPCAAATPAGVAIGRDRQPESLSTRPRDLVAFSSRSSVSGEDASGAVAASVEFAMSLQMGDAVDVLDRSGCWNDGVVLDVFAEGGRYPKFVLVRLALWSREVVEWVGVSEGRLLPRGVASGAIECVLSRSQCRSKKLSLTRQIADMLERSFPQRRARLAAAAQKEAQFRVRLMRLDEGKAAQKRKRRRVNGAAAAVKGSGASV